MRETASLNLAFLASFQPYVNEVFLHDPLLHCSSFCPNRYPTTIPQKSKPSFQRKGRMLLRKKTYIQNEWLEKDKDKMMFLIIRCWLEDALYFQVLGTVFGSRNFISTFLNSSFGSQDKQSQTGAKISLHPPCFWNNISFRIKSHMAPKKSKNICLFFFFCAKIFSRNIHCEMWPVFSRNTVIK